MGNIYSRGRDISCDFCGTGTENIKILKRDPSKGVGSSRGSVTRSNICESCLEKTKNKDEGGWERRIKSGRYVIEKQ